MSGQDTKLIVRRPGEIFKKDESQGDLSSSKHPRDDSGSRIGDVGRPMNQMPLSGGRRKLLTNEEKDQKPRPRDESRLSRERHPIQLFIDRISENASIQFTTRRFFLFLFLLLWSLCMWLVIIYKEVTEDSIDVLKYFTNVSFVMQAIFYFAYLFVFFEDPHKRTLERILLMGFFWLVFAQIVLVFVLVIGVLYDAPELVTKEMKSNGGDYDDGFVLAVERLFHVIPMIAALVFILFTWTDIADCLIISYGYVSSPKKDLTEESSNQFNVWSNEERSDSIDHLIPFHDDLLKRSRPVIPPHVTIEVNPPAARLYILGQYIVACMPFILYMLIIDLEEQYDISPHLATWIPVISVFGINLCVVVLPLWCMFSITIPTYFVWVHDIPKSYYEHGIDPLTSKPIQHYVKALDQFSILPS